MKYRVVSITNNPEAYPLSAKDTEEFPHLVDEVEDEQALFVVDENGAFWHAEEFFLQVEVREFETVAS